MGSVASDRLEEGSPESRRRAASRLVESHDAVFRRTARRYSICADDAEDAYQRSLEILLTKAPEIDGDNLVRWMQTVTKREAMAVRRQRERLLSAPRPPAGEEDRDPLDAVASERPDPTEHVESRERVARSNEALRALKPQEIRALTLKAEGYSYAEIGEITGWTYTKINRCMAEGRKRFLQVFEEIEQGRKCERLSAALSAMADGEADVSLAEEVHVHLRSCGGCRAKLRAFKAVPHQVLELMPVAAVDHSTGGRAQEWLGDRLVAATEKVRELGYAAMTRGAGDAATPVAATGGTRGAGMAALGKVLAVCGATAAGSAACVAGGVIEPSSVGIGTEQQQKPAFVDSQRPTEQPIDRTEPLPPAPDPDVESSTDPTSPPPPEPSPTQQANQQFSFESSPPTPSSGGGEFGGPSGGGSGGGGGGSGGGGFGFEK